MNQIAAGGSTTASQEFLIQLGTYNVHHSGRSLYEHLCGVFAILCTWQQPEYLCKAGMFHSIYSTENFKYAVLSLEERPRVQELIGEQAERLVYLFAVLSRAIVLEAAKSCSALSPIVNVQLPCHHNPNTLVSITGLEIAHLVLLDFANRLEQVSTQSDGIGFWLARVSEDLKCLCSYENPLPKALANLGTISSNDEHELQALYLEAVASLETGDAHGALTSLDKACLYDVVGEPQIMRAVAHYVIGDDQSARQNAWKGLTLMCGWGFPWHKCAPMKDWFRLADLVLNSAPIKEIMGMLHGMSATQHKTQATGSQRFFTYLKRIQISEPVSAAWYPGLSRQSWYNPEQFPITRELEARFSEIKEEALKVIPGYYYEEAENIARTGSWQVCMFYEQGRRNQFICEQCPITAAILDGNKSIRRTAGLIYFSKMAPHTHVAAHQGSSNIRVRCHLALSVPNGDCAIRIGQHVHKWTEGKCIVFDDTFDHEVWNHTEEPRLVLLIDLWHPDLTDLERDALDSINRVSMDKARKMMKAWERNDKQRALEGKIAVKSFEDLAD